MPFEENIIAQLPNELIFKVASQLDDESLIKWSETNQEFNVLLRSDDIWGERFRKAFHGCQGVNENYLQAYKQQMTYKEKLVRYFGEQENVGDYQAAFEQQSRALKKNLDEDLGAFLASSEAVRDDLEFALAAVGCSGYSAGAFTVLSERLRNSPEDLMRLIEANDAVITHFPPELFEREEFLSARLFNGQVSCRDYLQGTTDKQCALKVLEHEPSFFYKLRRTDLHFDEDILTVVLSKNGADFCGLDESLQENEALMRLAVENGGGMAVLQHGKNLDSHPDLLERIVALNPHALECIDRGVANYDALFALAVQQDIDCVAFCDPAKPHLITREMIDGGMEELGPQLPSMTDLEDCPMLFRNHFEFARAVVMRNGLLLKSLGPDMKNNRDIALLAIAQNKDAIAFVGEGLQGDEGLLKRASSPVNERAFSFSAEMVMFNAGAATSQSPAEDADATLNRP